MRNFEVCALMVGDIDLQKNVIRPGTVKGGKTGKALNKEPVAITARCVEYIKAYLNVRSEGWKGRLFLTSIGTEVSEDRLRVIVKKVAKETLIEKAIHPHIFRHTLASHMFDRGASLAAVKKQLRHSKYTSTEIYDHMSADAAQEQYSAIMEDEADAEPEVKPREEPKDEEPSPSQEPEREVDQKIVVPKIRRMRNSDFNPSHEAMEPERDLTCGTVDEPPKKPLNGSSDANGMLRLLLSMRKAGQIDEETYLVRMSEILDEE